MIAQLFNYDHQVVSSEYTIIYTLFFRMFSSVGSIGPYLQSLTESLKSSRLYQAVRIVRRAQNSPYDEIPGIKR